MLLKQQKKVKILIFEYGNYYWRGIKLLVSIDQFYKGDMACLTIKCFVTSKYLPI